MSEKEFDVVVVGASLAGCTAATLFAREGLSVALVERHERDSNYKHLCTHFIQASALSVLKRLGLDYKIEAAGGLRNAVEIHTPHGWVGHHLDQDEDGEPLHGYNIRRATLDPIVREMASSTPGVTLLAGYSAKRLIEDHGRISGVEIIRGDQITQLRCRLLVAADGRHSSLASMAGIKPHSSPNKRFGILAPMRHVDLQRDTTSQMWFTGREVGYVFPNDGGITIVAWMGLKNDLDAFRSNPVQTLTERLREMPDAPQFHDAKLAGRVLTVKDFPNLWRPPVVRGMALVGDAAMSVDYLWGAGCGWAFQSSQWLCDAVTPSLKQGSDLSPALQSYARHYQYALAGHRLVIREFSRRRNLNWLDRLLFSAGAKDVAMARHLNAFGSRMDRAGAFLSPAILCKAAWINFRPPFTSPEGTRVRRPWPHEHT